MSQAISLSRKVVGEVPGQDETDGFLLAGLQFHFGAKGAGAKIVLPHTGNRTADTGKKSPLFVLIRRERRCGMPDPPQQGTSKGITAILLKQRVYLAVI